jgi:GalNAc-alpha-(1->4)-GalNAc-alpha-(1->3)-diNAcBac-PP-undecaprenol alpha-1,4-N-acetyl-D-galactosaminyltransferase
LLFVCRMFDRMAGGVERMAVNIMNAMVERGHDVTLFTWDLADADAFFPMNDSIRWYRLNAGHAGRKAGTVLRFKRLRKFRALVRSWRPDVAIGFQHGAWLFADVGLLGLRIPAVLAERNAPARFDHTREGRRRRLVLQSMRRAAAITVQCAGYVERYPPYLRSRITVIPNPVYPAEGFASPGADREQRTLLSVGRLSYQKNYPVLVEAFARVADEFPDWRLKIVGEGEDRAAIEGAVDARGLQGRVHLDGATSDVSSEYRSADLFCLPSRFEGFPNTLAEAMAHGLPGVGFAGCAGIDELITPGRNGRLAEGNGDPESLARALGALMGDATQRARLGEAARDIVRRYEPKEIYDTWDRLFREVQPPR